MDFLTRLEKSRQTKVDIDGQVYVIRAPTQAELAEDGAFGTLDLVRRFVVDWPGMTEIGLGLPGGTPEPVPFSRELWVAWIDEQDVIWPRLSAAIRNHYMTRHANQEADAKN